MSIVLSCALVISVLVPGSVTAAIYKSIDSDGNIVFTDQPLEGAESVNANNPSPVDNFNDDYDGTPPADPNAPKAEGVLVAPQPTDPPKSTYTAPEEQSEFLPVTQIEILTPVNNASLIDPIGKIWVELQSYPTPLGKTGLTAQLWMNDQLVASGQRPILSLPIPAQGTHMLQVKLVDDNGYLFLTSNRTQIHVSTRARSQ